MKFRLLLICGALGVLVYGCMSASPEDAARSACWVRSLVMFGVPGLGCK